MHSGRWEDGENRMAGGGRGVALNIHFTSGRCTGSSRGTVPGLARCQQLRPTPGCRHNPTWAGGLRVHVPVDKAGAEGPACRWKWPATDLWAQPDWAETLVNIQCGWNLRTQVQISAGWRRKGPLVPKQLGAGHRPCRRRQLPPLLLLRNANDGADQTPPLLKYS